MKEFSWPNLLRSERFWIAGLASVGTVLLRPDFADMPWNEIIGQIITAWGTFFVTVSTYDKRTREVAKNK